MRSAPLLVALLPSLAWAGCLDGAPDDQDDVAPTALFALTSNFSDNGTLPMRYTCDGEGLSPPLAITGAPEGTVSLALTMKDPDVPTPEAPTKTLNHWVVWNITVGGAIFPEGSAPLEASEGSNDFGEGYLAPCPPPTSPPHGYEFTAFALDTGLALRENATADDLEAAIEGHILARAMLVGTYGRPVPPHDDAVGIGAVTGALQQR